MVRFLKFPVKQQVDKVQSVRVKRYILIIVSFTVLPSVYFAFHIVQQAIFKSNALNYINREFVFDYTQVVNSAFKYSPKDSNSIEVFLTGNQLDSATVERLRSKLPKYGLDDSKLIIKQGKEMLALDVNQMKSGILEDLYQKNELVWKEKDRRIQQLENQINSSLSIQLSVKDLALEAKAINDRIYQLGANQLISYNIENSRFDTLILVSVRSTKTLTNKESKTINNWLINRLKSDNVKVVFEAMQEF